MSEQSKNKITKIIQALLAKAAGTDNENEAALFLGKAQELMEKHQIETIDILKDDPVDMSVLHTGRADGVDRYYARLMSSLANYYGCRTVFSRRGRVLEVKAVGCESARVTTELMYPFILDQCLKAAKKVVAETGCTYPAARGKVINAMMFRLNRLVLERKPEEVKTSSGKNALVVVNAVKAKMSELFPDLKDGRDSSYGTDAAARREANGISLNHQTGSSETKRLR
jgi:hypothetical protein